MRVQGALPCEVNVISAWRQHFVLEEQLQEIEDTCIMIEPALQASGHVERFNDFMVRDLSDESKYYRADKLLEEVRFSVRRVLLRIFGICEGQCDVHTRVLQLVLWDGSPPRSSISRFLLRIFCIHRG